MPSCECCCQHCGFHAVQSQLSRLPRVEILGAEDFGALSTPSKVEQGPRVDVGNAGRAQGVCNAALFRELCELAEPVEEP